MLQRERKNCDRQLAQNYRLALQGKFLKLFENKQDQRTTIQEQSCVRNK